jgi:choline dehydrogenase-like flavoprotein
VLTCEHSRCSAACAHYTPFASRPNYTVLQNATVVRITWDKATKGKAIGVEYIQNGRRLTVSVGREVILAAGTIGSPKVLELSGVGNST